MELGKLYNIDKDPFKRKENNIFIAFCLGNKFFQNKKNIKKYIEFALDNTKEKILLLIVDSIQYANYKVRCKTGDDSILNTIKKESLKIEVVLNEVLDELTESEKEKITLIKWDEYEKSDPNCLKITHLLYKEFKNNDYFKNEILNSVKSSVLDRTFSEKEYLLLCDYVLDEFAAAYTGILYDDYYYDMFIYPNSDAVWELVYEIQNEIKFPKLSKKLPKNKVKLIILK